MSPALQRTELWETPSQEALDRFTRLAAAALRAPAAFLNLAVGGQQRLASVAGLPLLGVAGAALPTSVGICPAVVAADEPLAVADAAADPRWCGNPAVQHFGLRSYLGAPLRLVGGEVVGTLAVAAGEPRDWSAADLAVLTDLAAAAAAGIAKKDRSSPVRRIPGEAHDRERYFRALIEHSADIFAVLDAQGVIRFVGPSVERVLGYSPDELLERPTADLLHPDDAGRVAAALGTLVRTPGARAFVEYRIRHAGGQWRHHEAIGTNLLHEPAVAGIVVSSRDVTLTLARERQLQRAERLASMGALLSGVAHELNNPLNAIINFSQLMLLDPRSEDDREALEIMRREGDRAAKIVSDLRSIARQAQEVDGERALVDLNDVVRHILKLRRYTLETHNIDIETRLDPLVPPVWASRPQMEQVLLNLVLNAERALLDHHAERRLSVGTHVEDGRVVLRVSDTGPGIAPDHLGRVFDPFFTTKPQGEGTGLGLSLVHGMIAEHGGEVTAQSPREGGAMFTVLLPPAAAEGAPPAPPLLAPATVSLRVLLVDDEPALRRSLSRFLARRGHRVEEAADGAEALRILDAPAGAKPHDVVLSDLRMPGLGGEALLRHLRDRGGDLHGRVVFMTGDAASRDAARILERTGAPALIKPVRLEEVARVVESVGACRRS